MSFSSILFSPLSAVIQYHYTETEYSFTETAPSSEVCLRIISGVFAPGGYLTLSLFTSTLTAIGQHTNYCKYYTQEE